MARRDRPTYADGQGILFQPESDWREPESLPDPPSGTVVAVDTETKDDGLSSNRGPGWVFGDGHIAGFSAAWRAGGELQAIYVPLRHPESRNTPVDVGVRWLQTLIDRAERVVFQNGPYDIGWLSTESVEIPAEKIEDTHAAAVLLDENRLSYSLDSICQWRGVPGKDERQLREAAAAYGLDPKKDMWRMPAQQVGEYGEQDARSTLLCWESMIPEIRDQGMEDAYRLEMDLIPMTLAMRRRGIRVDEDEAERTMGELRQQRDAVLAETARQLGWSSFNMDHALSPGHLERAFQQEGIPFPRTPRTQRGSFKSDWMDGHEHWLPSSISRARKLSDMSEKFIGTYILGSLHVGRVHAEIHQLRDDDGGTRSFRLSYSNPPLQQMPARDPELAPLVRRIMLSEADTLWGAADYSQQEPRMAVHFAALCGLTGADTAVGYYLNDPDADFHTMVAELTGLSRKQAKIINLGLMYGMGVGKLAASLGVSTADARDIITQYNARMPFIAALSEFCSRRSSLRGHIRLLDGARCRFDLWEPSWRESDEPYRAPCSREAALQVWPGRKLRRAFTHKAMNRLIQGSSARQTKMAMRECWRAGILPLIQMHDELGAPISSEAQGRQMVEIMQDVVQLRVPMKVDMQYGWNWGQASEEPPKGVAPASFDEVWGHPEASNADLYAMREAA